MKSIPMAVAPLFGFLTSFCFIHLAVHCEIITQESAEVPLKALCSRKCETQQESADKDFPLYQCSCSRGCSIYGDCCFDSEYRNTTVWHKTDFVCLSLSGQGRYRAVFSCPPNRPSDLCIDVLGHLPPVTSSTTNVTYANVFCASCNGDRENLVTWNVKLSCPSELDEVEDPLNDTTRMIYHFGDIWRLNEADGSKRLCTYHVRFDDFSFLEGLELRPCTNAKRISSCSPTWKDFSTMQMCRSYANPVYFHNTAFQNTHCAECNYLNPVFADCMPYHVKTMLQMGLIDTNVARFCQTRGSDTCIQTLSDMQKGRMYAFADLLNINEKACLPPRGKRCCHGEAFDFRTQRCRKIIRD